MTFVSPPHAEFLLGLGPRALCPRRRDPVVVFMCVSGVAAEAEGG